MVKEGAHINQHNTDTDSSSKQDNLPSHKGRHHAACARITITSPVPHEKAPIAANPSYAAAHVSALWGGPGPCK